MPKKNSLTFLIIGLGSMGKRRIRNLLANGERNIIGFDFSGERRREVEKKYGIVTLDKRSSILPVIYDVMIISTPPQLHGEYIRLALKHDKHFFVEAATSDDGYREVLKSKSRKVHAPSCTFRFFEPVIKIKKLLSTGRIGKILAFQNHLGQYLPDWHPWEDYRNVYFAKKESGACREMFPYELNWLNWLVDSEIERVEGFIGKVSTLDMQADDVILSILQFKTKVLGSVIIDVVSRHPLRKLRVEGEKGVLKWDWLGRRVSIYDTNTKKTTVLRFRQGRKINGYKTTTEEMYEKEIAAFLSAVKGGKNYPYSFEEDSKNLNALYKLESNKQKFL